MKKISLFILFIILVYNVNAQKVRIVHTNDIHGNIVSKAKTGFGDKPVGGYAALYTLVKEQRVKALNEGSAFYLFSAGDVFQGTAYVNITTGRCMIPFMNALRYDGMTIGNHEFDYGQKPLRYFIKNVNFPVICSNIVYKKSQRLFYHTVPYKIYNRNGLKIAVVGVLTDDMKNVSLEKNISGLEFLNVRDTVQKYVDKVRKYVDIVIVLSHIGYKADKKLAKEIKGVDIILGGHTNTPINKLTYLNGIIYSQTSALGRVANVLTFDYDKKTKKIKNANLETKVLFLDRYPENKDIKKIADRYVEMVKKAYGKKVGYNKRLLISRKAAFPADYTALDMYNDFKTKYSDLILTYLPSDYKDLKKPYYIIFNLGSFICDIFKEKFNVDMAFTNSGGIRANIDKGDITLNDVFNALPFDNTLITANLKGKYIKEIFEHSMKKKRFMQFSKGLKVVYNFKTDRVEQVYFNGKPIQDEKEYKIVTNNFLISGGDGYEAFTKATNIYDTCTTLRDAVNEYIEEHKIIDVKIDDRAEIIK